MRTWIKQRLSEKPSVFREKEPHPCFPDGEGDGGNAAAPSPDDPPATLFPFGSHRVRQAVFCRVTRYPKGREGRSPGKTQILLR